MTLSVPSLDEGTLFASMGLPAVWPVIRQTVMLESQLSDGTLVLETLPTGQLRVELWSEDKNKAVRHSVSSPVIRISGEQPVLVTIIWKDGFIQRFDLNARDLIAETGEMFFEFEPTNTIGTDFSQKNEQARLDRYSKIRNLPDNPRRKLGGDAYMYASLKGEIDQIEDLVSAIQRGRDAHIPGLASRIRLLVIGKPMGLLQHCAALTKSPLIVYSDRYPEKLPPITDAMAILGSVSAQPNHFYCNPVDLDVWLDFPALKVAEIIFSHRNAIKDVGDTIGSHRDPGIPESLQLLQLTRTQMGARYRDVQRYTLEVADVVLSLSRHVLLQEGCREAS